MAEVRLENEDISKYQEDHMREVMQFEHLQALTYTISNISEVLLPIFGILSQFENGNVVFALGDSGVGKSTLIASLVHGADSLEMKEVDNDDPSAYRKTRKVVDHKSPSMDFAIGHN